VNKAAKIVGTEKQFKLFVYKGLHSQKIALNCKKTVKDINFLAKQGCFYAA